MNLHPSYDAVIQALHDQGFKPKQAGAGHLACCPAHDDHKPSLSIHPKDDGGALIKCFSNGCDYKDILQSLNLWTEIEERKEKNVIPYHVLKGVKLHHPAIVENNNLIVTFDNGSKQTIYPNRDKRNKGPVKDALFFIGGDDIAIKTSLSFLVATGYSTTASLHESTGSIAVGVASDGDMDAGISKLRSRYPDTELVICADYDARDKFTSLALKHNARLCYAPMVNSNPKSDFNDLMIASGKSAVCEVIGDAKFISADSVKELSSNKPEGKKQQYGITGADLLAKKFAAISWVVPDILPDVGAYLLAGKQKMGKSWFSLALALAYTQGGKFLNRDVPKGCLLYTSPSPRD